MEFGERPSQNPGHRDAGHVPAVVIKLTEYMQPGDSVRFTDADMDRVEESEVEYRHGILDPFADSCDRGERVWVMLVPRLAVNLVHHFEIDARSVDDTKEQRAWCRDMCGEE